MKLTPLIPVLLTLPALLLFSCKKESEPAPVIPKLIVSDFSVTEGSGTSRKAIIALDLSEETTATVSFSWSTEDGTAKAGEDYTAVTGGEVIFTPGELYKTISIDITSDNILEFYEIFNVKISNLSNVTATKTNLVVTIENDDSYKPETTADGWITPDNYPGMTLVWSDEFNGTALNNAYWNYEQGGGGWGNSELQVYTNQPENSFVKDGYLTIKAVKNPYNETYTSARLTTKGKKEFTYGRIDIRAKLPVGQGIWPALWTLGGNISTVSWPSCGEIDIMEYLGHDPNTVYGTIHYNESGHKYKGSRYTVPDTAAYDKKFHVFTIIWQESSIEWFVDYRNYYTVTPSTINFEAFYLPQFFIFNVAVGGVWPGYPNATTVFPQSMIVDYVRVFQ